MDYVPLHLEQGVNIEENKEGHTKVHKVPQIIKLHHGTYDDEE